MDRKITVIGSINMDLVTQTNIIPKIGETVMGEAFHTIPGGKGANQAVAAARLSADVNMIGLVGGDAFGEEYIEHLRSFSINTDNVEPVTHAKTGIASIILAEGDNSIIVVTGANNLLTPEIINLNEKTIAESSLVLLQLEIPLESVIRAAELAKKHGVKVILNPAPFQPLPEELLQLVDYITPNEYEAELLLASTAQPDILKNKLIITRGAQGVTFHENGQMQHVSSYKVEVKDTTGAGDTFNGAFAVAILEGKTVREACEIAAAAGALSVTKLGAQTGMPTRAELEAFLAERKGEQHEETRDIE
ncbi:ribokinase [Mesobacillus zeae]|uniref:Ribokinase n=1 Tax=Mesobacillus zeae TaxID=1917180 RepID=A0A398B192_9BACI|nr:ribokinase [Mesobacillus zeae]RID81730.1 ribokinase [Mesobacillus zeae]